MLSSRLKTLSFCRYATMDFAVLTNYDGLGRCEKIIFQLLNYDPNLQERINNIKENLEPWANLKSWSMTEVTEPQECRYMESYHIITFSRQ